MAENQWGPKPFVKPPPSVMPAPAFWGSADVPDQVRGQPRVDSWVNKDYSWEPRAVEASQGGEHGSWVAPVIDQNFPSEAGVGDQGTKGNFLATHEATEGGEHGSWVAPVIDQEFPSELATHDYADRSGTFLAEAEASKGGEHGSWVAPVLPQYFPSELATHDYADRSGTFLAEAEATEGGAHDTFVAPVVENPHEYELATHDYAVRSGTFLAEAEATQGGAHDTFVAPVVENPHEYELPTHDYAVRSGTFLAEAVATKGGDHDHWIDPVYKQFFPSELSTHDYAVRSGTYLAKFLETKGLDHDTWVDTFVKPALVLESVEVTVPDVQDIFNSTAGTGSDYGGENVNIIGDNYVGSWNFEIEIDGITAIQNFISISGITSESDPIKFKFGSDKFMRTLPGAASFGNVELTRVYYAGSDVLWKWRQSIESGLIDVRNMHVRLRHVDNKTVVFSMTLHDCWPIKWEAPEMNAGQTGGAIEKITFDVNRVTKEVGNPGLFAQIAGFFGSLIG